MAYEPIDCRSSILRAQNTSEGYSGRLCGLDWACQSSWLMFSQILPMKFWPLQEPWRRTMRFEGQMSDPGHKKATCPKCYSRKTLFDGRMGRYCMFCGHKFNSEEVQALPEYEFRQTHTASGAQSSISEKMVCQSSICRAKAVTIGPPVSITCAE